MADLLFNLEDPRTYGIRVGGLPDLKFVYSVKATIVSRFGQSRNEFLSIRSSQILNEQEILNQSAELLTGTQKERYQGTVENLEVTGATRPEAMGGL